MHKNKTYYFLLMLLMILLAGCPALNPEDTGPKLEVWRNVSVRNDRPIEETPEELRVLDIDPGPEGKTIVYLRDPVMNVTIPGNFSSNSSAITVSREDITFAISGIAGSMGVVTFTNRSGSKNVKLHVFVRNWKKSDVFRHTLEPWPQQYQFSKVRAQYEKYGAGQAFNNGNVFTDVPNSWAIYKLLIDQGFFYESPDGVAGQGGQQVHNDNSLENWYRGVHNVPHIIYYPDKDEDEYRVRDDVYGVGKEQFLKKPVFAFLMHYEKDGDMVGGYPDRQRMELKTMNNSTPPTWGYEGPRDPRDTMYSLGGGETFTHRWKFKLPANFSVSTEYTHIHQIKPEGADNGNPTFTLTCRKKSNGDKVMQLIYRGPIREMIGDREIPSVNWYPAEVPLEPFLGEWIRAEETVTYDNPGAYRIKLVRISDMRVLLEWEYNPANYEEEDPFVMFRRGNTYVRQKTGVYRRIMHMTPFGLPNPQDEVEEYKKEGRKIVDTNGLLISEIQVLYTEFEMDKWRY